MHAIITLIACAILHMAKTSNYIINYMASSQRL